MEIKIIQNELLQSASYLFGEYLVDCGDSNKIIEMIGNSELKGIFLTHCHQDHIYGIETILKRYPSARVYCSEKTYKGLKDERLNLSYIIPEHSFNFTFDNNVVILDEGVHLIGDMQVEVVSCIGHSEDCLAYIIEENFFTGDAHIPFAKVFTKWPTSKKDLAIESEKKLLQIIAERNLKIRPGHWQ